MDSRPARATSLLLDSDEVSPVFEQNAGSRSPFLFASDHFGRLIPNRLGNLGLPASELGRHIAFDVGIAGVAERLSFLLGAHLIAQRYSRLVIDCNRPPDVASSIPLISDATAIPGNAGLARDAAETRRREIFDLYHRDTALAPLLLSALRAEADLVVGDNEPYAVSDTTDYTIPVHGEARGLINTGIEIRQDLIADETGQQQWAERLARILRGIETTLRRERLI